MIKHLMKFRGIQPAVAGIIMRGDKVLLTKRTRLIVEGGKWCLPGGHIKKCERIEDALKREVKEEIGLDIKKPMFLFFHEEFVKRLNLHAIVFVFVAEMNEKVKKNWEVSEIGWFDRKEIDNMDFAFTHRDILKRFFKERRNPK